MIRMMRKEGTKDGFGAGCVCASVGGWVGAWRRWSWRGEVERTKGTECCWGRLWLAFRQERKMTNNWRLAFGKCLLRRAVLVVLVLVLLWGWGRVGREWGGLLESRIQESMK